MNRSFDQLIDAYPNPLHSQQRVLEELLCALADERPAEAAAAAAILALKLEHHGAESDLSVGALLRELISDGSLCEED